MVITDEPVPAAIDAMVGLWRVAPELVYEHDGQSRQLLVVDGPALDDIDEPRAVFVGVGSLYLPVGAQSNSRPGYGARRMDQFDVLCQLQAWSGDTDLSTARADAFGVLRTLGRLLTVRPDLGGVVDRARIARSTYQPAQTQDGVGVLIDFTVQVEATRFEGV